MYELFFLYAQFIFSYQNMRNCKTFPSISALLIKTFLVKRKNPGVSKIEGKYSNDEIAMNRSRKFSLLIGIIIILLLIIVALLIHIVSNNMEGGISDPNSPNQQTEVAIPGEKLTDSINLPGYGGLNLKAGVKEQNLALPNPAENFCQIRISLILEDGTVIWTSELIPPGETAQIFLNEAMGVGEYTAVLKYECFRMDENQTPLNGATSQLVLYIS